MLRDELRKGNLVLWKYIPPNRKVEIMLREIVVEIHQDYVLFSNQERGQWDRIYPMPFTEISPRAFGFVPEKDSGEWIWKQDASIRYKPGTFTAVHELQNWLTEKTGRDMAGIHFVK